MTEPPVLPFPAFFFDVFRGLPRQGPGSKACTLRALEMLRPFWPFRRIVDIGCGTGAQTLDLMRACDASVLAVDFYAPFLEVLEHGASAEGLESRLTTSIGDMRQLELEPAGFDLVWSEGAIYNLGFAAGLRRFRSLLEPFGAMAVTEATLFSAALPEECRRFWENEYPALTSLEQNLAAIRDSGLELVGHFPLPATAWTDEYYQPMSVALERARSEQRTPEELAMIAQLDTEIDIYDRFGEHYGYVFYVMRRHD